MQNKNLMEKIFQYQKNHLNALSNVSNKFAAIIVSIFGKRKAYTLLKYYHDLDWFIIHHHQIHQQFLSAESLFYCLHDSIVSNVNCQLIIISSHFTLIHISKVENTFPGDGQN